MIGCVGGIGEHSLEFEVFKMYSQAKALDALDHAATGESGKFRTPQLLARQTLSRYTTLPVGYHVLVRNGVISHADAGYIADEQNRGGISEGMLLQRAQPGWNGSQHNAGLANRRTAPVLFLGSACTRQQLLNEGHSSH
jgi:hypothetical protein